MTDVENNMIKVGEGPVSKRLSMTSMKFDRGQKGFLTTSERLAREFANKDTGEIPTTAVIELVGKQRAMNKKIKILTIINIVNFLALVALAIALGIIVSQGDKDTQDTITSSIHTKVASDPAKGLDAILTDVDGNTISTIAGGSSVTATSFIDANSGNMTICISMNDLTQMVLNNENGIRNTMSIKDEDSGDITSIVNLDGDVRIGEDEVTLASGKYHFIFNSPACSTTTRRYYYNRRLFNEHLREVRLWGGSRRLQPGSYTATKTTDDQENDQEDDNDSQIEVQGFRNW